MQPFGGAFLQMVWLSLLTNVLMLVPTLYMLQLYDRVMLSRNTLTLLAMTLLTAGLLLLMAGADWLRSLYAIKTGVQFDLTYGKQVFSAVFDPRNTQRLSPAESLQQLTAIRQFMTGQGLFALLDIPWSVIYIGVLFALHPVLGATALVFCLLQSAAALLNQRMTAQPAQSVQGAKQGTDHFLQQKIQHLHTSYVLGMLQNLRQRWQALLAQQALAEAAWMHASDLSQFVSKWVRYTLQSLMLAVAAWLTIHGEISVGSMVASNVLIARALHPFDVMVQSWRQWLQAQSAAVDLHGLLSNLVLPASMSDTTVMTPIPLIRPYLLNLQAVGVTANSRHLLHAVTLTIQPGRLLCVMGPSGAGKSTLARLLVGVTIPTEGRYQINQSSITADNARTLMNSVGYLPQQVSLLEGTIAENVARFGQLESQHILQACQRVGLHEAILRLPQGYDTRLDEQGLPLSGGQRQLLGLARAIYKEPALLVLDEPNASLDEFGEARLLELLQALKTLNTTIVVISHRSGVLKITDDLLVLKRGEVVHHGPRDAGIVYLNQLHAAASSVSTEPA
ncbi:ATP-binding cassette domain-containing protein [Methylophilus medardicus]|uniref:ATP-binding cassette domain-containing protein n=2 Tax=Methylophilus medardicus TaxID=2588534 RepID=A0A5B8CW07_9PROT|nr:ATP-binding cassette domain-containing protein [Methylophilus medardicus]QDC50293.1 ATP-binding cassette domain-containing protein [Methylophilus medardicus]QDC53998.1 ATP-binding cassette domain-containing protein [Methylophilus medardicus]